MSRVIVSGKIGTPDGRQGRLVVDKGVTVRWRYQQCGQEWQRTHQRPPRWPSRT